MEVEEDGNAELVDPLNQFMASSSLI